MFDNRKSFEFNDTGYYQIGASQSLYHSFSIEPGQAIIFSAAHTSFYSNQNWSIRVWASEYPSGISITGSPLAGQRVISPLKTPQRFGFYDVTRGVYEDNTLLWSKPIAPNYTYYINIENVENRQNGFYLKIDFVDF